VLCAGTGSVTLVQQCSRVGSLSANHCKQVNEIIEHAKDQKCTNPAGYIIRALAENWIFWSKPEKKTMPAVME